MVIPGNNDVTDRLLRHFIIVGVDKYSDATVEKIFANMIVGHFASEVISLGGVLDYIFMFC
jgi:hypothetical protein